jgi:hypothetical protein
VPWTLENEATGPRLVLTEAADVFDAASLHRAMTMLAGLPAPLRVDLAGCRDLDSSILQLLLALRRAREAAGHPFVMEGAAGRVGQLVARFLPPDVEHRRLPQGGQHGVQA